jgi:hypothetical protein
MGREGLEPSTLGLRGRSGNCGPLWLVGIFSIRTTILARAPTAHFRLFVGEVLPIRCPTTAGAVHRFSTIWRCGHWPWRFRAARRA